jgi:hypothetical protein
MAREGRGYLQQICTYLGSEKNQQRHAGRIFPVTTGIMGRAFGTKKIQRTRHYDTLKALRADLKLDLLDAGRTDSVEDVPVSYLSVPFLGPSDEVVLTLYAECDSLNFFANDVLVNELTQMCRGFCALLDWLNTEQPFPTLRNYPQEIEKFQKGKNTVFSRLQEGIELQPPKFKNVTSLNFDASVG